jgi:hypothetical protein
MQVGFMAQVDDARIDCVLIIDNETTCGSSNIPITVRGPGWINQ